MIIGSLVDLLGGVGGLSSAPFWPRVILLAAALTLCLAISVIDARRRIIPDSLNAMLAGLGLALAGFGGLDTLVGAALEGVACFAAFWLFRRLYRAVRGFQGLGFGDVKFLGAAAIWVGIGGVAPLLLVACLVALVYAAVQHLRGVTISGRSAIPFGPFLALGLAAVLGGTLVWPPDL